MGHPLFVAVFSWFHKIWSLLDTLYIVLTEIKLNMEKYRNKYLESIDKNIRGGGKIILFKYGSCDKKWYVLLVGAVLIAVVFGSFSI